MLSGGLDSAVLLYLLLKEDKTIAIQPFSIPKHDDSHLFVDGILKYFENYFNITIPNTILVGNPEVHHSQQSTTAVRQILTEYPKIDFIYFGTNQNPARLFDYSQFGPDEFPDRVQYPTHPKVLMPFIKMYKDEILKILFDNDQQALVLLTHSCTEKKTGRCGQCFQCKERAWAFDQLDQTDPGIN